MMNIRDAAAGDWAGIWPIWQEVVRDGTTYDWDSSIDEAGARSIWMKSPPARVFVAEKDGIILGSGTISPNRVGRGSHVANASYMVAARAWGQGIGRALCEHSLERARLDGYHAMQFNAVVETNVHAIALYEKLGFRIIGTAPEAFRHAERGLVGFHIMYRRL